MMQQMMMSARLRGTSGSPTFTVPALIEADLEEGEPARLNSVAEDEAWRLARVQTYVVSVQAGSFTVRFHLLLSSTTFAS